MLSNLKKKKKKKKKNQKKSISIETINFLS